MLKISIELDETNFEIWNMPLYQKTDVSSNQIILEDIRKYYFEHTKRTLRIEDAKYLLERAEEMGLDKSNGGVEALFSSLKYKFNVIDKT